MLLHLTLYASFWIFAGCSPAAESPAETASTTETGASADPSSEFESGTKSTTVTGASIADLDFVCASEAEKQSVEYTYEGKPYIGSKLTCDPVLPVSASLGLADSYTNTVTDSDGVKITWNVSRLFGSFLEDYICFTGDDVSKVRLTCYFNESNLAAKVVVDMEAVAGTALQLTSESKSVTHSHEFYNDCIEKPDWDEFDSFGTGTRSDPFVLCNGSQLADLRNRFANGHAPGAMAGYYRIGRDLGQISGDQMISTSSSPFTGVIQGNGYSFGISVDLSVQALESYAALIKYTDGADIDYFTITNLTITGELVTNATNYTLYLASLVGSAKKTKISRITIGEVNIDIEIGNVVLTGKYSGLVSEADESIITDITIGKVSFAANYTISCDPAGISVFGGLATLISGSTSVSNVNIGEVNFESNCGFFSSSGLVSRIDDAGSSLDLARVNKFESLSGGSYGISQTNYGTISRASVGDIRPRCFYLVCDGAGISRHNYGTITKSSAFWTAPTSYAPSPNVAMSGLVTNNYGTLSNSYVWGTLRKDTATGSAAISGLIGQLGTVTNTYSAVSYLGSGTAYAMTYQANATFTNSFWDSETGTGATAAAPSAITGVSAKSTAEMKTESTFTGWNFSNIWKLDPNSYPTLR